MTVNNEFTSKMSIICEDGISQVRIVPSVDAVTNHLESGLKHASVTGASCSKRRTIFLVSISNNTIVQLSKDTAMRELSLWYRIHSIEFSIFNIVLAVVISDKK